MKNNFKLFNEIYSKAICNDKIEWTNTYIPKVQSTVKPKEKYTYNEIHEHINKQLKND
jgi:glucuronate isomerase